jgi:2-polyprenyl-6-methoxyphenol hydroxylase-like FAD-dependent oxidoreductase
MLAMASSFDGRLNGGFSVCIRGGGIVGRTLALLLAKERLKVALVVPDVSDSEGHSDVRAYALNQKSKSLLESLRCWPDEQHATPVLKMQVQGDDGGEVIFNAADANADALAWIVDVPVLEAQLAQATKFQPQIEQFAAPQVATLTVVCEGKASSSREQFGVEFDVMPYAQCAVATRLQCEYPHHNTARQWFAHESILGVLPMSGGNSVAVVWSTEAAQAKALMAMSEEDFCHALQGACHESYGGMTLASPRAMWPLQLAQTRSWVGLKDGVSWALAGDAAHTVHPLSGQGLNLGLWSCPRSWQNAITGAVWPMKNCCVAMSARARWMRPCSAARRMACSACFRKTVMSGLGCAMWA